MNKVKRIFAFMLAVMLAMAMAVPALAAQTYSITVKGGYKGETYTAYKIFDVAYSPATNPAAYAYTITDDTSDNNDWFSSIIGTTTADGDGNYTLNDYGIKFQKTSVDGKYNVVDAVTETTPSSVQIAALAVELAKHTTGKTTNGTGTVALAAGEEYGAKADVTINVDPDQPGYYFVTTTTGALCALTTTAPAGEVQEKNTLPAVDKKQSKTENDYLDTALDFSVGDTVYYQLTVTDGKGTDKAITLTDTMSEGLTYTAGSIKIGGASVADNDTDATDGYTVSVSGQTITITISAANVEKLTENDSVVITYAATVDEKAKTKSEVTPDNSNKNTVELAYLEHKMTDFVTFDTYKFQLVKTDSANKVLTGAQFRLYDSETGTTPMGLIKDDATNTYRPLTAAEKATLAGGNTTLIGYTTTIDAGTPIFTGFAPGKYYFEETLAPTGYNILTARASAEITNVDNMANFSTTTTENDTYTSNGLQVKNQTGIEMPTTGGIGTTIFYVLGAVLLLGAGILLVTKKRMSKE